MRRCSRCVMPETRPGSVFDEEGVCLACLNYEKRINTDWGRRWEKLEKLCAQFRHYQGYDCLIPVSGGKDSHLLVNTLKNELGMHPLLFTVTDPFTRTEAGKHNIRNLSEHFGCDHETFTLDIDLHRRLIRQDFEAELNPLKVLEMLIYIVPIAIASRHGIMLVFFGENSSYLYGTEAWDRADVINDARAMYDVLRSLYWKLPDGTSHESGEDLRRILYPPYSEGLFVQYMSHYINWSDEHSRKVATEHGFWDLGVKDKWEREGWLENYTQIDSVAYIIHIALKYPKFGFARVSDVASRWVRSGKIARAEAMKLVEEHDHKFDPRAVEDFCSFCGYSVAEFWKIVQEHPLNRYMKG